MHTFPLKPLLLLFVLLLTFGGCKKNDHGTPQPPPTEPPVEVEPDPQEHFTLRNPSGTPGDLIHIKTEKRLPADSVTIAVGDKPVTLYRLNDTAAVFRLPVLAEGKVNVDLSKLGGTDALSFTVGNYQPIEAPEEVKDKFIDSLNLFMQWADTLEDQSMMPALKGLKAAFLTGYAQLSDEEKLQVAYFLDRLNNGAGIERQYNSVGRLASPASADPGELRSFKSEFGDKALDFIAKAGFAYGFTVTGVSIFLFPSPTFVEKVCGVALCIAGIKLVRPAKRSFKELIGLVYEHVRFLTVNEWGWFSGRKVADPLTLQYAKAYDLVFLPGKRLDLQIPSEYQSLSKKNADQSSFFTTLFDWIDDIKEAYATVKQCVDKVRSWGSFFADQVTELPAYDVAVPDAPQTETAMTPAEELRIENVSNPNITLSTAAQGEVFTVTATGKDIKATTPFTFDVVYRYEKLGIDNKITVNAVYVVSGLSVTAAAFGDTAKVEVTGGLRPYTFKWSNGRTDSILYDLKPGVYTVTVTDAMDSTAKASVEIESDCENSNLGVMAKADGRDATAMATGGVKPYTYLWSTGATDTTVYGLPPGEYIVTATDSIGCTATTTVVISETCESSDLRVTAAVSGNTVTAEASGGKPAYTFSWSNGASGNELNDLGPGLYTVTVQDAAGCSASVEVEVKDNTPQRSLQQDAAVVKELLQANGLDVSDSRWQSTASTELEALLRANGCSITENRISGIQMMRKDLTSLPTSIGELTELTSIDVSYNKIKVLPASFWELAKLTGVDMSYNELSSLDGGVARLSKLRSLKLYGNQLTHIPVEVGQLTQLEYLWLGGNQLSSLPASVYNLINLRDLQLSNCQFTSLPDEIGNLVRLTRLGLSSNPLTTLPASIGQLTNLVSLNLSQDRLTSLPASIGNLVQLEELYLQENQLVTLPTEIGSLEKLERLTLMDNQLTSLPESMGQLHQLVTLEVNNNQLTGLPSTLGGMTNLKRLEAYLNQITVVPESIGQLHKLENLDLRSNKIAVLPSSIGNLESLKTLKMPVNQLTSLPESIGQLKNLSLLELHVNLLTALPASIGQLENLVNLNLYQNMISHIPASLGNLKKLSYLNLKNNLLTCLPQSVWDLNLAKFDWSRNGYFEGNTYYELCGFGDTQCDDHPCSVD